MSIQRYHSLGVVAISSALLPFSDNVIASTTTTTISTWDDPVVGCVPLFIADGYCDIFNNHEDCEYDGGDCCACTCVSTDSFICGEDSDFACLDPSAECVDDDDVTTLPGYATTYGYSTATTKGCFPVYLGDGFCDQPNNNEKCGYDGGDCCECTCVDNPIECGVNSNYENGFACLDPSAPCFGDDDFDTANYDDDFDTISYDDDATGSTDDATAPTDDGSTSTDDKTTSSTGDDLSDSSSTSPCLDDLLGDGNCDSDNNIVECGYDGGDCCECDCVNTDENTCGGNDYDCVQPESACSNGYVLASTKTTIAASANAYDTRAGEASGDIGCGEDGCTPALSLDGNSDNVESRWSCAQKIVLDGGFCEIEFTFEEPQDIMDVQVAFWNGENRDRTLEATINGEVIGEFQSYREPTFNALGIVGVGVHTLSLKYVDPSDNGWISLLEVRFLVDP